MLVNLNGVCLSKDSADQLSLITGVVINNLKCRHIEHLVTKISIVKMIYSYVKLFFK